MSVSHAWEGSIGGGVRDIGSPPSVPGQGPLRAEPADLLFVFVEPGDFFILLSYPVEVLLLLFQVYSVGIDVVPCGADLFWWGTHCHTCLQGLEEEKKRAVAEQRQTTTC